MSDILGTGKYRQGDHEVKPVGLYSETLFLWGTAVILL